MPGWVELRGKVGTPNQSNRLLWPGLCPALGWEAVGPVSRDRRWSVGSESWRPLGPGAAGGAWSPPDGRSLPFSVDWSPTSSSAEGCLSPAPRAPGAPAEALGEAEAGRLQRGRRGARGQLRSGARPALRGSRPKMAQ